jgi:flavodoxin
MSKKSIVLYYSASGNTAAVAKKVQALTSSDIAEIVPQTPYAKSYNALLDQAKKEIREGYHPKIQTLNYNLNDYDVIYLGSPVWWGTFAPPLATLLSEYDLIGKTIAPFVTHGGGGKDRSDRELKKLCINATVTDMLEIYGSGNRSTENEISSWLKTINL